MRLSHAAARKYALIMSMRLLVAMDPDHGCVSAQEHCVMSPYLQGSMVPYCMSVARFYLHARTETMAASILPQCVPCERRGGSIGYVPRELSCKLCLLSSVALRVPGASA